jgi:hypothetical protein
VDQKTGPLDVKQEMKKLKSEKKSVPQKEVLFKFEYEGDDGEVRSILVREVR